MPARDLHLVNLATSDKFAYVSVGVSTPAAFVAEHLAFDARSFSAGNLFMTASASTVNASISVRAEIWHSWNKSGSDWFYSTSLAQEEITLVNTGQAFSFYVKEYGPYIRLKYAVSTSQYTASSIAGGHVTFRPLFAARSDVA